MVFFSFFFLKKRSPAQKVRYRIQSHYFNSKSTLFAVLFSENSPGMHASSGDLVERQFLGPILDRLNQKLWGWGSSPQQVFHCIPTHDEPLSLHPFIQLPASERRQGLILSFPNGSFTAWFISRLRLT